MTDAELPTFSTLLYEEADDGVATVTLNRPDRHNAFDYQMCDEMRQVWERVRQTPAVRAVVLTAAGETAFCTGIDRQEVPADPADYTFSPFTYVDPGGELGPRANECWKPVIAAVNGMACAGAFYLLGEADVIIAADHATFFDPHVTYNMPAVFEPTLMMSRMPFGEVMRMSITGNHERISAQRAYEIGLVSEVVPMADLGATARQLATAVASQPAAAVQATVRTLWAARELSRSQAIALGNTFLNLSMSADNLADGEAVFRSGSRITPKVR